MQSSSNRIFGELLVVLLILTGFAYLANNFRIEIQHEVTQQLQESSDEDL